MKYTAETIKVGVIGLGRSGWGIHIDAFKKMPDLYTVVSVHDVIAGRLAESAAAIDAKPYSELSALLADPEVELVVVASPNKFHFEHALQALAAGKHVLCEKPFGRTVAEVDQMIIAAAKASRILQPFQQRRYEPDFLEVLRIVNSGLIGRVQQVRICWHGFKRRWDWQTDPSMGAGELYNNGPHPIDHAMLLMGDSDADPIVPDVWCERRHGLCSGSGEDHIKIILSAKGRATVDIEVSNLVAFGQDRWHVCGTAGGLKGSASGLEWKYVDWSTMPPRPLDLKPTPDRTYNSESLTWKQDIWSPATNADAGAGATPASQPTLDLYTDLYHIIRSNRPQIITPKSVRRRVDILERCAAMAPVIS